MAYNNVAPLAVLSGSTPWNVVVANNEAPLAVPTHNTRSPCWTYDNVAPVAALDGITSCMVDNAINEAATSAPTCCAYEEKKM